MTVSEKKFEPDKPMFKWSESEFTGYAPPLPPPSISPYGQYEYQYKDGGYVSAPTTIQVKYEMQGSKYDLYKVLTGQQPPMPKSKEFWNFVHRFQHDWAKNNFAGHVNPEPFTCPPMQLFPWPGWWELILGFDQVVHLITGEEPTYNSFGIDSFGSLSLYPKPSGAWTGEMHHPLDVVRSDLRKSTKEVCAMCGEKASSTDAKALYGYTLKKYFHFSLTAKLPLCQPCYSAKIDFYSGS